MMWVSRYFVYFILYGVLGWLLETLYCTLISGKWADRGFLYGPLLPIYGVGGAMIMGLAEMLSGAVIIFAYSWWQVYLVAFLGSMVLEYVTSWALEKLFHAYWWDYSNLPFNINGRVCLQRSLLFGLAGLSIVYFAAPLIQYGTAWIPPAGFELLALLFMAIFMADLTLTVSALTHFEQAVAAMEDAVNAQMGLVIHSLIKGQSASQWLKETLSRDNQPGDEPSKETPAGKAEEEIEEVRQRLSREGLERLLQVMGNYSRAAIGRVKGFRKSKPGAEGPVEHVHEEIKKPAGKKNKPEAKG